MSAFAVYAELFTAYLIAKMVLAIEARIRCKFGMASSGNELQCPFTPESGFFPNMLLRSTN